MQYPVDIAGRMLAPSNAGSPLSDIDIVSRTNPIYVNESGDSMSGILDMKTNKIINLGIPNRNDDASNKFYVDNSIVQATKNYGVLIKELENLGKTNEVLRSN